MSQVYETVSVVSFRQGRRGAARGWYVAVGMWEASEAKLVEMKAFFDAAPRKDGKLTRAAEAGARKVLEAG